MNPSVHSDRRISISAFAFIILLSVFLLTACSQQEKALLLFAEVSDRNAALVEAARASLQKQGVADGFSVFFTEDAGELTEEILRSYEALVFLYTSGEVLADVQRADVERYVQAGGRLVGVEASPQSKNEWTWYGEHMQLPASQLAISPAEQLGGQLEQALGHNPLNYQLATTQRVPEENRFTKEILDFNLDEPMELDELPGRGILFVERRGAIKLFDFAQGTTRQIARLPLFYGNEDGLLGIAVDPNYEKNNWIYLFYSAPGEEPLQHISRFDLKGDSLHPESEKVLLKVPTIRKCCHSGGALEFGPEGNLFITLGDNTNPFESSGYAPIDERAGRALWDAQKSAANTNDLRGKILRIKPEDDGTYSIPEGNLFPPGTPNTRPEIYVMGCRNPFRPAIDSKTGFLYWGDVGPDAGKTDPERGPKGMGEFNQARTAGFWGWPYTRGNNQLYNDYDFTTETSGPKFDPQRLINDSPNNTGLQELPPARQSMIWFSYDASEEFPWLGKGGVNPMAGPVFHAGDQAPGFPAYFENKLFVYEWMRDWIYVVTLDENQNYVKAEAFMPDTEWSHPMDMLFGADGSLYVLEYGQKWNARNLDARLSKVSYIAGNRAPIARIDLDREVGAAPLQIQFSAENSEDFDADELTYEWTFSGREVQSTEMNPKFTFEDAGAFAVQLTVRDADGLSSTSTRNILVGNEPPRISIKTDGGNNTYWDHRQINYTVEVTDREDGTSKNAGIDPEKVKVTLTYVPQGEDIVLATIGHQQNTVPEGLQLIDNSDCKACHARKEKVNGPSYEEIAAKYDRVDKNNLISRVIKGSSGIWGETMMAAHPQLTVEQVGKMVDYILSLKPGKQPTENQLPLSGTITLQEHMQGDAAGKYVLMASYLDEGNASVPDSRLSASEQLQFIAPKLEAEHADDKNEELGVWNSQGATVVGSISHGSFIRYDDITYEGLKNIRVAARYNKNYDYAGIVEVRAGSMEGEVLGTVETAYSDPDRNGEEQYDIPLRPAGIDRGALFLVFRNPADEDQYVMNADWVLLEYDTGMQ